MVEKRTVAVWINGAIGVAGAFAIFVLPVLAMGPAARGGAPTPERILVTTFAAAASVAWVVFFTRRMFVRLDEFQQQGSRVAWYWGGSLGLAASTPLYAFIGLGGLHWLWPATFHLGTDLYRAFVVGYMLPILCQVLGAVAVGAWWRLSRR
jgi:hypothetical protein